MYTDIRYNYTCRLTQSKHNGMREVEGSETRANHAFKLRGSPSHSNNKLEFDTTITPCATIVYANHVHDVVTTTRVGYPYPPP